MTTHYLNTRAQTKRSSKDGNKNDAPPRAGGARIRYRTDKSGSPYYLIQYSLNPDITAYLNTRLVSLGGRFINLNSRIHPTFADLSFVVPVKPEVTTQIVFLVRRYRFAADSQAKAHLTLSERIKSGATADPLNLFAGRPTNASIPVHAAPGEPSGNTLGNPGDLANRQSGMQPDQPTAFSPFAKQTPPPEQPSPQGTPARVQVNTPSASNRTKDAPDITVVTGQTPHTANEAVTLAIRTPKHPEHPEHLHNGYSGEGLYDYITSLPGASWVKAKPNAPGYFRVPITLTTPDVLKSLRHHYGLKMEPHTPTLNLPAAKVVAQRISKLARNYQLSRESSVDIALPVPAGLDYLPYQKAGIAYAARMGNALIADEPGLGKTIQAIGVSNVVAKARRILLITPASLKINWSREWQKWCTKGLRVDRVRDGKPQSWPAESPEVVVMNYDLIEQHEAQIKNSPWDIMIIDEAHALKSSDAKRTKLIFGSGSGKNRVPGIPARRTLLLTGTPILSRPAEIWTLAHALDPDYFRDKHQFERRYCEGHKTKYGWIAKGASNLKELRQELRSRIMVRRLKSQVLKDLPPKTRQLIELDHPSFAIANGHYARLEAASKTLRTLFAQRELLREQITKSDPGNISAQQAYKKQVTELARESKVAFHQMSEVRKETALMKVSQVMNLAETALANGKLILFCHHAEVVDAYRDALNTLFKRQAGRYGTPKKVAVVSGKTPNDQRQVEADRFQDDPDCQVFIGTIQAAGTGLTLTKANAVLFAELDWVPGNVTQAEDRAHRIGQLDHTLIYHAVIEGTLDSLMARRLIEKQAIIDESLDEPNQPNTQVPQVTPKTQDDRLADWLIEGASSSDADPLGAIFPTPNLNAETGHAIGQRWYNLNIY